MAALAPPRRALGNNNAQKYRPAHAELQRRRGKTASEVWGPGIHNGWKYRTSPRWSVAPPAAGQGTWMNCSAARRPPPAAARTLRVTGNYNA